MKANSLTREQEQTLTQVLEDFGAARCIVVLTDVNFSRFQTAWKNLTPMEVVSMLETEKQRIVHMSLHPEPEAPEPRLRPVS